MKMSSMGGWFALTALLALLTTARAADSLEPAVNTSAPERAPAATLPPATAPVAPPASAAAPDRLTVPAAKGTGTAVAPAAAPVSGKVRSPAAAAAATNAAAGADAATTRGAPTRTPAAASARDRVELENTQITGNRELPKVMYVVPWKKPDLGDFGGRPAKSLLDELLEPVDRDVFRRQNRYFEALQPDAAAASTGDEK